MSDHLDGQVAPITSLMAAAAATTTLRLGAMVFCNDYRQPVVLAKEAPPSTCCRAVASNWA